MKHTASLTQGNILQVLLRFSIPFLLANPAAGTVRGG